MWRRAVEGEQGRDEDEGLAGRVETRVLVPALMDNEMETLIYRA